MRKVEINGERERESEGVGEECVKKSDRETEKLSDREIENPGNTSIDYMGPGKDEKKID